MFVLKFDRDLEIKNTNQFCSFSLFVITFIVNEIDYESVKNRLGITNIIGTPISTFFSPKLSTPIVQNQNIFEF